MIATRRLLGDFWRLLGRAIDRPEFDMADKKNNGRRWAGEGVTAMIVTADAGDNPPRTAARTLASTRSTQLSAQRVCMT